MAKVEYITNYEVMHDINQKDEKLCKLLEERETDYFIFKVICELAKNSFVVMYERWFDVEIVINVKKNNQLLYDLSSKLARKFKRSRKVEGLENFYITLRVFKMSFF